MGEVGAHVGVVVDDQQAGPVGACSAAPEGFAVTASTDVVPVAAFENDEKKLYGVQYHPEVMHT
ncbi:glutamine amidotransferase-related protein, partial [Streptomyces ureilyticus]|uniref:glutamine amidotransferase-related protein n=1 Tax=Streptomyces ureilyticus TaxID=1775131 RepID=UPI001F2D6CCF